MFKEFSLGDSKIGAVALAYEAVEVVWDEGGIYVVHVFLVWIGSPTFANSKHFDVWFALHFYSRVHHGIITIWAGFIRCKLIYLGRFWSHRPLWTICISLHISYLFL